MIIPRPRYLFLLPAFICLVGPPALAVETCTYDSYTWNTREQRAENFIRVEKLYAELDEVEIDAATGCSVCEQDQRWIEAAGQRVRVCKVLAAEFQAILDDAAASGFPIRSLVGYRVGKTRGDADAGGLRTRFSNHSFGIAIDVNTGANGLYTNCIRFGAQCKLHRGGAWRPGVDPASITAGSRLVEQMKAAGFNWGGEIEGWQKDFMHFSPSGY